MLAEFLWHDGSGQEREGVHPTHREDSHPRENPHRQAMALVVLVEGYHKPSSTCDTGRRRCDTDACQDQGLCFGCSSDGGSDKREDAESLSAQAGKRGG